MADPPSITSSSAAEASPRPRPRRRYSIATVLAVTMASLVIVAALAALLPVLYLGRDSTVALLREKGDLVLNTIELRVRQQMEPVVGQLDFLAEVMTQPAASDHSRIGDILTGALSATPQIASLSFVGADYVSITAMRSDEGVKVETSSMAYDSFVGMTEARTGGWWSGVIHNPSGEIYIVRQHPVWSDGRRVGMLFANVSVRQLSSFLMMVQPGIEGNGFILYDHDYVLAHPRLTRAFPYLGTDRALPRLDEVDDPVLAAIWNKPVRLPLLGRSTGSVHAAQVGDSRWIFLYRTVTGYGEKPWLIGTYFRASDALADLDKLFMAGIGAGVALLLATVAAILLGRRIARPITQLALVARHLRTLRFSGVPDLPRSTFRELDDQARAFEDMLGALRWFESYVPRKVVRRLVLRRERGPLPSVERQVTVMFTDIVGFTPMSEPMSAVETARLLNRHFEIVTKCIEAEDGTVDKFIGDCVMAFWGGLSRRQDHAERAVRAASAIATAIWDENRVREAAGQPIIRLRIGLHTGPAVIGNIGSAGRVNYTIVGDTVNAAQRIEQLGRRFLTDDLEVVVLFSAATEHALGPTIARTPVGTFTLRGRAERVPIFRLILPPVTEARAERAAVASAP